MIARMTLALALAGTSVAAAQAPDTAPAPAEAAQAPVVVATPAATGCCTVADGTLVEVEIAEVVSSKTAQRGQRFRLRLAEPLRVGETTVLPAGTPGVGEVVHAEHARAGGKAGELLIAARCLEGPGMTVHLRALKLGAVGKDHTKASLATAFALGPAAMLVHGGESMIPEGAPGMAKITGPVVLPAAPATAETPVAAGEACSLETPPPAAAVANPANGEPGSGKEPPTPPATND